MMSRGSRSGVWYPCQGLEDQCIFVRSRGRVWGGGGSGVVIGSRGARAHGHDKGKKEVNLKKRG